MKQKKGFNRAIKRYVPSTLELEKIIENNPPVFNYSLSFFIYLVSLPFEIPARNRKINVINGFVPLNAVALQKTNRRYNLHLDYLIQHGILETDNHYIPIKKSKGYRIAEKYMDGKLKEVLISDKALIRNLDRQHNNIDIRIKKKYKHLFEWWNENLTIDSEAALEFCYAQIGKSKERDYYGAFIKAYSNLLSIKWLENEYWWFTVDSKGNRLHTNITNLNSALKSFVKYAGQELVQVDIRNSQPYLSIKLLEQFYNISPNKENNNNPYNTIMLVKGDETIDISDVYRYIDLVVGGRFYEFLVDEMKREWGNEHFAPGYKFDLGKKEFVWRDGSDTSNRAIAKSVVFEVMFSPNSTERKEKALFRKIFPNVMRVFDAVKEGNHSKLSCGLQKLEASIILDDVTKILSKTAPDIPLYTIHDCIVTTVGNEDMVADVMTASLTKAIGYPPTLKPEYWRRHAA